MPLPTLAVVVTYYPDDTVAANIEALRPEVDHLIVVDNGSPAGSVEALRACAKMLSFRLLENNGNLGTAAALNRALAEGRSLNTTWVLLFDQDSRIAPGYVQAMVAAAEDPAQNNRLGILVPRYQDLRSGRALPVKILADGTLEDAITSGTLLQIATLDKLGPFAEELFLDGVDHEMSLRVRRSNLHIRQCLAAVLLHSPGTPVRHSLVGSHFHSTNYSPLRRYYQARSAVWTTQRYWRIFPGYCFRLLRSVAVDAVKILLAETGKRAKCSFALRGLLDGLRNRMGPYRP